MRHIYNARRRRRTGTGRHAKPATLRREVDASPSMKKSLDVSTHSVYNYSMTPKKPLEECRTEQIHIRVTHQEKSMVLEAARQMRFTISQYLMWLAHNARERSR